MNDKENKHAKVFVGGISIHTTDEGFNNAFKPFGEITDSIILRDPDSERSRGFGFITFSSASAVERVLDARPITIDDRQVDVKRAIPKEANNPQAHARTNKVFIGGLPNDITKEELGQFFSDKGAIDDIELVYKDGLFRGFGFITFSDYDTADKVIVDGEYDIRDNKKFCRVSKAGNRTRQQSSNYQYPNAGAGAYPGSNFGGQQQHSGNPYYGGGGGGGDGSYYGSDFSGGYPAPKSGYMGTPRGGYQGHSEAYPTHGGGYSGGPPSGGYDSRGYGQTPQTSYNPGGPSPYSGDFVYGGYGGHSGGGGAGTGSGYAGGSGSQYMPSYKGEGVRGGGSGGRGNRSRYKPY